MTTWRKSTASAAAGECVEVKVDQDRTHVLVRDSKDQGGAVLRIPIRSWWQFLDRIVDESTAVYPGVVRLQRVGWNAWDMWLTSGPGTRLRFTHGEARAFLDGVTRGEFEVKALMERGEGWCPQ